MDSMVRTSKHYVTNSRQAKEPNNTESRKETRRQRSHKAERKEGGRQRNTPWEPRKRQVEAEEESRMFGTQTLGPKAVLQSFRSSGRCRQQMRDAARVFLPHLPFILKLHLPR